MQILQHAIFEGMPEACGDLNNGQQTFTNPLFLFLFSNTLHVTLERLQVGN